MKSSNPCFARIPTGRKSRLILVESARNRVVYKTVITSYRLEVTEMRVAPAIQLSRKPGRNCEVFTVIGEYIDGHNQNPKPFIWTAKATDGPGKGPARSGGPK